MKGFENVSVYVEGKGIVKTSLKIENGIITYIGDGKVADKTILDENAVVLPGFIDEHTHGSAGADAMDGTQTALETIADTVASEGTCGLLATTMTQSPENITNALNAVRDYRARGRKQGAEFYGVHLEGPFISPSKVGAQPPEYVAAPDCETFKKYNEASGNCIRIVSMAPECQGAKELAAYLKEHNIVASVGHTDATYAQTEVAVDAGMSNITHTYNAQRGFSHREPGVVGAALMDDRLNCEIICDTIHVCVPSIKLLIKNKPHDKLTIITDSMRAKNMGDCVSELGGQTVYVKNGEARLKDGTLAGSVLRMNVAIKNLVEKCGVSLTDAVDFASANPAKNIGIYNETGSIAVGKRANFAILNKNDFSVIMTVRNGEIIYKS